jgi:hypothetical protein
MQRDPVRQAVADATRSIIEDLGKAVTLCLRYHSVTFRGHRPARLGIMGGESSDPYVCDVLSTTLGMPIAPEWPLRHVDISRMPPGERRGPLSGWAAALGLGLRRVSSHRGAPAAPRAGSLPAGAAHVVELPEHASASTEQGAAGQTQAGNGQDSQSAPAPAGGDKARLDADNQRRERACA